MLIFNGLVDSYIDRPYTDPLTSTHPYPSRFHLGVGEAMCFEMKNEILCGPRQFVASERSVQAKKSL